MLGSLFAVHMYLYMKLTLCCDHMMWQQLDNCSYFVYSSDGADAEGEDEDSDIDLDAVFDVDKITTEQTVALNVCGHAYGMTEDDFFEYVL